MKPYPHPSGAAMSWKTMLCLAILVLLLLPGCGGSESGQGEVAVTPTQVALVFNEQQANQLAQRVSSIARIDMAISGPDLDAPRTTSVPVSNPTSGGEIPLTFSNAPVGTNRTLYVAAFDAAGAKLFSGSASGVTLPSASPIPVVVALPFRVTVNKQGGGSGTVTSSPSGIDCGSDCVDDFDAGVTVTLTASADPGSAFAGWSGGGCSGTGACTVTTGATIVAIFNAAASTAELNVTKSGSGTGTVTSSPSGISCGGSCSASFVSGSSVTLNAAATGGSTFAGWSGGGCSGTGACVVVMNGNQTVNAEFIAAPSTALLSVAKAGGGNGTVSSTPAGISCGGTCSASFTSGSSVTLTAVPTGGATFSGWSGSGCSGTGDCVVVMNGDQTVTATFIPPPSSATLTVNKTGSGAGTVTSAPGGINCGDTCSAGFTSGSTVTLSADPSGGSVFAGWNGAGCAGTGPCVIAMNGDQTVTAEFSAQPSVATLTVVKAGAGSGTVSSAPPGINSCADTCSAGFTSGSSVTLSANPSGGSTFAGWSGGGCTGAGSCTVMMNGNQTVIATFDPPVSTVTLTVNKTGSGSGTVTSVPPGIDCGPACTAGYPGGTAVTLTATAGPGSVFTGWSGGGCNGTGPCQTVMSGSQTVVAQFDMNADLVTLSVNKSGDGNGTVTSMPTGINCGGTCTFNFARGTTVTLTATPDGDSEFDDWSGSGCNGDGLCVVVMSQNRSVTAEFDDG